MGIAGLIERRAHREHRAGVNHVTAQEYIAVWARENPVAELCEPHRLELLVAELEVGQVPDLNLGGLRLWLDGHVPRTFVNYQRLAPGRERRLDARDDRLEPG